ncbi:MAG: GHMP kinase [Saprospiraceae bacterium]|nr:GHMP kinase [Saprospiraceae bacterium]
MMSSEYLVMFGATALALPCKLGQKMKVQELNGSEILWNSFGPDGKKWFSAEIDLMGFDVTESTDESISKFLRKLLKACCQNNSEFLSHWKKYKVDHYLEFPLEWGLGSSSTLIHNMAGWADVNPYHLYFDVADGSGYDVACAGAEGPILYTLGDGSIDLEEIEFKPSFKDKLYFVPLKQKVSSKDEVQKLKNQKPDKKLIEEANHLTEKLLGINSLDSFESWIKDHEKLIQNYTGKQRIKDQLFSDYFGEIKSLGAWGGDLVLVTAPKGLAETENYFKSKGFDKIIPYAELIL